MPAAARQGDQCTGHGAYPPRVNDQGSPTVRINGRPAHRVGDHWVTHCDPSPRCHDSQLAAGSATVRINGQPAGRVGDPVACGSTVATGSPNVRIGG